MQGNNTWQPGYWKITTGRRAFLCQSNATTQKKKKEERKIEDK